PSDERASVYERLRYWRPKRRRSSGQTSHSGRPSTIHSLMILPTPPAPASPCAQPPVATQKPSTSVSPSRKSASGVNASGPLKNFFTSAVRSEEHTSELQSRSDLVCRLLLEKKKKE